jgi:Spy/CpxP family protein refolding chaperone
VRLSPGLVLAAILLTGIGGGVGGWLGVQYGLREAHANQGLDDVLHHELGLSAEQNRRIEALETDFTARRHAFETEMEGANRELARALETQHSYGPDAHHAIERFHVAMGALQEATIEHILAMRAVLTPEQAVKFDRTLSQTLAPAKK